MCYLASVRFLYLEAWFRHPGRQIDCIRVWERLSNNVAPATEQAVLFAFGRVTYGNLWLQHN